MILRLPSFAGVIGAICTIMFLACFVFALFANQLSPGFMFLFFVLLGAWLMYMTAVFRVVVRRGNGDIDARSLMGRRVCIAGTDVKG